MSCAEALRRCPQAVFVRPRHRTYRELLARGLGRGPRGRPDGRADRDRRGLPGRRGGRAGLPRAPGRRRGRAGGRPRRDEPLLLARRRRRCKVVAKVASDRRKPGGITVVRAGREAAFLAPFAVRAPARRRPAGRGAPAGAGVETIGELAALSDERAGAAPAREGRAPAPRPRPRHRPAAARRAGRRTSRSATRRPSRATSPTASGCTTSCGAWPLRARRAPGGVGPGRAHGDDEAALPGLLDPQPLDDAAGRARGRRADRRARLRRSSTARSPTGPARSGSSASGLEPRGLRAARARVRAACEERLGAVDGVAGALIGDDPALDAALAASAVAGLPRDAVSPLQGRLLQPAGADAGRADNRSRSKRSGATRRSWSRRQRPRSALHARARASLRRRRCARTSLQAGLDAIVDIRVGPALETSPRRGGPVRPRLLRRRQADDARVFRGGAPAVAAGRADHRSDNVVRGGSLLDDDGSRQRGMQPHHRPDGPRSRASRLTVIQTARREARRTASPSPLRAAWPPRSRGAGARGSTRARGAACAGTASPCGSSRGSGRPRRRTRRPRSGPRCTRRPRRFPRVTAQLTCAW